jgi:hypothetical protein
MDVYSEIARGTRRVVVGRIEPRQFIYGVEYDGQRNRGITQVTHLKFAGLMGIVLCIEPIYGSDNSQCRKTR